MNIVDAFYLCVLVLVCPDASNLGEYTFFFLLKRRENDFGSSEINRWSVGNKLSHKLALMQLQFPDRKTKFLQDQFLTLLKALVGNVEE